MSVVSDYCLRTLKDAGVRKEIVKLKLGPGGWHLCDGFAS
ncbi:hypothetical protein Desor_1212 [Desulfosporosinus orientis DSM 765]|uniref:Uncharacterized protein n=1 Tax=Desulfosporosinus orientis (strain ATCC 19365 / DSM 765 / NCIMB 8382 / VKM B-1628 / Singapore I) TaxID=768706 RepID=G7WCX3_DESOD|nr:hypothetical protein Desor_1212 [Desulfosporosinus orientis DSM 765]